MVTQETNFGGRIIADGLINARVVDDQYIYNSMVPDVEIPGDQATINDKLQQEMAAMTKQMATVLTRMEVLRNIMTVTTSTEESAPKGTVHKIFYDIMDVEELQGKLSSKPCKDVSHGTIA